MTKKRSMTAQEKLRQALIALLDEKGFDQLSISNICKKAGVHRSTFYAYYDNQYDLLTDAYNSLVMLFEREFAHYIDTFQAPKEKDSLIDSCYLLPYLHFIKKHQKLYKIYLKRPIDFAHARRDEHHILQTFTKRYQQRGLTDEKQIRYMSGFYLAGLRQLIYQWLENDCQDDVDFLIALIHQMIF